MNPAITAIIVFIVAPLALLKAYLTEKENKILRKKLGK
jgi:hypothetical protein